MSSHHRPRFARALPALGLALVLAACAGDRAGLEVTRCEPWGEAGRAGIEAGDRLLAWRAGAEAGALTSPLELFLLEVERGSAETVELTVVRGGRERTVRVEGSIWALEARPAGAPVDPPQGAPRGGVDAALERLGRRAAESEAHDPPPLAAWWRLAEGDLLIAAKRFGDAVTAYARARSLVAEPRHQAAVDDWQTHRWIAAARFEETDAAARRALAVREAIDPDGPAVAASLHHVG